ncbi:hypothetical protein HPB47_026188 [Ixodes persulcatus]|uniref:Uncharacterized protein n=1 Tax=Ixodes persulcatus TaxID=34615 RepID=A0AC60PZS6_IXOPE|nr:hypothetical protein HPB47_026188 [Ixodes persulcatus]
MVYEPRAGLCVRPVSPAEARPDGRSGDVPVRGRPSGTPACCSTSIRAPDRVRSCLEPLSSAPPRRALQYAVPPRRPRCRRRSVLAFFAVWWCGGGVRPVAGLVFPFGAVSITGATIVNEAFPRFEVVDPANSDARAVHCSGGGGGGDGRATLAPRQGHRRRIRRVAAHGAGRRRR